MPEERRGKSRRQAVYHGKQGLGENRSDVSLVRLEYYASDAIGGKECVVGEIPEVTI